MLRKLSLKHNSFKLVYASKVENSCITVSKNTERLETATAALTWATIPSPSKWSGEKSRSYFGPPAGTPFTIRTKPMRNISKNLISYLVHEIQDDGQEKGKILTHATRGKKSLHTDLPLRPGDILNLGPMWGHFSGVFSRSGVDLRGCTHTHTKSMTCMSSPRKLTWHLCNK